MVESAMRNPHDRHFDTAHEVIMKELASSPPAPIVDSFMVGGDGISDITGRPVPPEKWMIWFAFPDESSLQLAQREKCPLISRRMKESLKESGFPAVFADQVDIRFCSKETIDKAGSGIRFLEEALGVPPVFEPVERPDPGGALTSPSARPSGRRGEPLAIASLLLGLAAVAVVFFGYPVGLPEWLKWGIAAVLTVPSAMFAYQHRRGRKRQSLASLAQVAEGLGFRVLPDPKASLGPLGILRAPAFRGHRVSWGLERAAPTETTILAGARPSAFADVHHLVVCWSLVGSPLPDFDLSPETLASRVASALGAQDIDFDVDPNFSARYRLRARDEHAARRVFRPEVRSFFTRGDEALWLLSYDETNRRKMEHVTAGWRAESRDGWLIVWRPHPSAELALKLLPGYLRSTQALFELLTARR